MNFIIFSHNDLESIHFRVVHIIISGGRILKMNYQHRTKHCSIYVDLFVRVDQLSILIEVNHQRLIAESTELRLNLIISEPHQRLEYGTYTQTPDQVYCRESVRHYRLAS
jgi:hypothetical protein